MPGRKPVKSPAWCGYPNKKEDYCYSLGRNLIKYREACVRCEFYIAPRRRGADDAVPYEDSDMRNL